MGVVGEYQAPSDVKGQTIEGCMLGLYWFLGLNADCSVGHVQNIAVSKRIKNK